MKINKKVKSNKILKLSSWNFNLKFLTINYLKILLQFYVFFFQNQKLCQKMLEISFNEMNQKNSVKFLFYC